MNSHVASRGVTINFGFPAGGSCFNCPNKIFPRLLVFFISGHLISQFAKVILFWSFYCYNFYHADFHRKLFNQAFR